MKRIIGWALSGVIGVTIGVCGIAPSYEVSEAEVKPKDVQEKVVDDAVYDEEAVETESAIAPSTSTKTTKKKQKASAVVTEAVTPSATAVEQAEEHKHNWVAHTEKEQVQVGEKFIEIATCSCCGCDIVEMLHNGTWEAHYLQEKAEKKKNWGTYSSWSGYEPIYEEQDVVKYYTCECGERKEVK